MEFLWKRENCLFYCCLLIFNFAGLIAAYGSYFSCYWNEPGDINCSMCNMLNETILDCSNKGLEQVTVNGGHSIIGLNLSHNRLSKPPNIYGSLVIEWIDLSHNNIMFLFAEDIERLSSHTLKVIDISCNGLLTMTTQNLGNFLPNLSIFNLSNNLLSTRFFEVSDWKRLHHLKMLDLRNKYDYTSMNLSPCDLGKEGGVILLNSLNCSLYCIEAFLQIHCEFDYLFVECLCGDTIERNCSREDVNRPTLECNRNVSTTNASPMTTSTGHMPTTTNHTTNHTTTKTKPLDRLPVYFSLAGTFLVLFLLIFTVWKCYQRSQRSNRYDKWLSVYTTLRAGIQSIRLIPVYVDLAGSFLMLLFLYSYLEMLSREKKTKTVR